MRHYIRSGWLHPITKTLSAAFSILPLARDRLSWSARYYRKIDLNKLKRRVEQIAELGELRHIKVRGGFEHG